MGTFVCIIVLAYSKRQQFQYWIPTLAILLVYYPFALVSPYNGGHAHVSPPPVNIAMRRLLLSLEFRIRIAYVTRMTVEGRVFYISAKTLICKNCEEQLRKFTLRFLT